MINRFEVLEQLGHGGMGTVWKAYGFQTGRLIERDSPTEAICRRVTLARAEMRLLATQLTSGLFATRAAVVGSTILARGKLKR